MDFIKIFVIFKIIHKEFAASSKIYQVAASKFQQLFREWEEAAETAK